MAAVELAWLSDSWMANTTITASTTVVPAIRAATASRRVTFAPLDPELKMMSWRKPIRCQADRANARRRASGAARARIAPGGPWLQARALWLVAQRPRLT